MKNPFSDRLALSTAAVGVVLMILTLVWRVNPVEGSVTADFLTRTEWGHVVIVVLLITCLPAAIVGLLIAYGLGSVLCFVLPISEDDMWIPTCVVMIIVQAALYFGIGKLISICWKKIRNTWASPNSSSTAPPSR